jgi:hypothetical protein
MRRKCLSLSIVLACVLISNPANAHNAGFHMALISSPHSHLPFAPILHNLHSMPLVSVSHSVRQIESAEMFVSHNGVNQLESPALLEARKRVMELEAELLAAQQRAMGIELFKGFGRGAMTEVERLITLHNDQNFAARISFARAKFNTAIAPKEDLDSGVTPEDIRAGIVALQIEESILRAQEQISLMRIQEAIQRERVLQGMIQKKLVDFFTRRPGATVTNKI